MLGWCGRKKGISQNRLRVNTDTLDFKAGVQSATSDCTPAFSFPIAFPSPRTSGAQLIALSCVNRRWTACHSNSLAIFVALLLFTLVAAPAIATPYPNWPYWTYWQSGTGSWHDSSNWHTELPHSDIVACIDNGGTAHITADAAASYLVVGDSYAGNVTQPAGTNTITWGLYLGRESGSSRGTYNLSGGSLASGIEDIGLSGAGAFTQSGGTNTMFQLYVGHGSGSTGTYILSGGSLSGFENYPATTQCIIGYMGAGTFTQSGETNTNWGSLLVGYDSGATGTYNLSGGSLASKSEGIAMSGTGTFNQSGGTNAVEMLYIGGGLYDGFGTYNMGGGLLEAQDITVSSAGIFNVTSSEAAILISRGMGLMAGAVFSAVPGTTIHMTESYFYNGSTDETALAGLANLNLIFEGCNEVVSNHVEIAGWDFGADPFGFTDNFVLGGLTLGGADAAYLRLVNDVDNGNRGGVGGDAEALYVKKLVINEGSTLNLNGYNLYTLDYTNLGGTILDGSVVVVPEPATLALIAPALIGFAGIAFRRMGRR